MDEPLTWVLIGGGLIAAGLLGIAIQFLPIEFGLAATLAGATVALFGFQQQGIAFPKIPSVVVWIVVAVGLFVVFSFMNAQHAQRP